MKKRNIIFYIPDEIIRCNGVFQSQVLEQARFLNDNGFQCLIVGSDVNKELAMETEKMIRDNYGVQACISESYSDRFPFFSKLRLARKINQEFWDRIVAFQPSHISVRSSIAFESASKIAQNLHLKLIYDVRGATADQALLTRGKKDVYYYGLGWLENRTMRKAERISCVSHRMGVWIKEMTGRSDYTVIPCCASHSRCSLDTDERQRTRERFGYSPRNKVICYVGGISKWQKNHNIIRLFKDIYEVSVDYRFLIISRQKKEVEKMIKNIGLEMRVCYSISCEQTEVSTYLRACDASIIMRDDILTNNVSSPVKIGEYLSAGLPLLLTKGIGDMSELIPRENAGIIIDENHQPAEQIIKYLSKVKYEEIFANQQAFVEKHLVWDAYTKEFDKLYS